MSIDNSKEIFDQLYAKINGKFISNIARRKLNHWYIGHIYGEVTYRGFLKILSLTKLNKNEIFYDLGSGTGKGVMLAAMLTNFSKVIGIEILKELHDTSKQILENYKKLVKKDASTQQIINFIHGDFKEIEILDADVIFMNATCMEYEFDLPFIHKLEKLKKGTRIITNTICVPSDQYRINKIGLIAFTWGEEEVFIHERI